MEFKARSDAFCFESMYDAVPGSEQYDEHEDAPCYGKARQERTQLVTFDGSVYFLPKVYH